MRSRSCLLRNLVTTSDPNVKDTPRSFSPQPDTSLSGSLHSRSHSRPGIDKDRSHRCQVIQEFRSQTSYTILIRYTGGFPLVIWLISTSKAGHQSPIHPHTTSQFNHLNITPLNLNTHTHNPPVSGTSVGLMMRLICSILCRSGLRPPWQQKIFSSMMAAMGKQLKQSVNVFHNLVPYLLRPAP